MTTLHSPAISIATCSYSRKAFLKTTMLSVFWQSGISTEYIVINGVLSDRSATAIEKYSPGISYWVSEPDSWQSQALDKCLRRARRYLVGSSRMMFCCSVPYRKLSITMLRWMPFTEILSSLMPKTTASDACGRGLQSTGCDLDKTCILDSGSKT